jgi:hypothetical protein
MEAGRQREPTGQATKQTFACHFLHRYYMDRGRPSRLPYGSLRSALTGPDRDPGRFAERRKWQAMSRRPLVCLPLVGARRSLNMSD